MKHTDTLIKWPGGKSREIKYFKNLIPKYDRYIEPFFGGGAMFFHLEPKKAFINDISASLMEFYTLIKNEDKEFYGYMYAYWHLFKNILQTCNTNYEHIYTIYQKLKRDDNKFALLEQTADIVEKIANEAILKMPTDSLQIILSRSLFQKELHMGIADKMQRTIKNEAKHPFSSEDLKNNLITGIASGVYMYFRGIYNDIALNKINHTSAAYNSANFYFIREYCYGSMFRYNKKGEFNIPYGGMSYNTKNLDAKLEYIFSKKIANILGNATIHSQDFEVFLQSLDLNENDFLFLDPPYDTNFSEYEGKDFTLDDQKRLANFLKNTNAHFLLIIKNTDFIHSLYENDFHIFYFDKTYTYNVRSRNERNVEHLIITNINPHEIP